MTDQAQPNKAMVELDTSAVAKHSLISEARRAELTAQRDELRDQYLIPAERRPASSARGVHHLALISRDVRATVEFYQGLLEFPLTEMFENRDLGGSTHFFFDIGNGNLLAFFDLPGVDPGPYAEVLGGLHHLAISVEPERWAHLRSKLDAHGIAYLHDSGSSLYFNDPDGARLELISDPLLNMYGHQVG
jgi:catechol 2,3-dioxygenase-like lactoylglutathione lyase family enzyme